MPATAPAFSSPLDALLMERERRQRRAVEAVPKAEMTPDERADHCIAWINANCKVMSDTGKGPIPFVLYDYQQDFIRAFWHHRELIVLKARQIGMTETVAALAVYCIHHFPGWTIIILSQDLETVNEAMAKCRVAYDYLPDAVRIPVINTAIISRIALVNRSRIIVKPTTANSARSLAAQVLIIDEWARQAPYLQAQVFAAAAPTARSAGNRIIGMSTANGVGNFFHQQWVKATEGDSAMTPIFLPWSVRPGRDQAWYDHATANMEPWQSSQEFPSDADEAFILSGRPRFDIDALKTMQGATPVRTLDLGVAPDGKALGHGVIWEMPRENGRYVLGVDTAEGLEKGDYSAAVVLDYQTGLDVAELHGHWEPEEFARHLATLGRLYNDAYAVVEANNHGASTILAMVTIEGYTHLHYQQDPFGTVSERPGWKTTTTSKPVMIDALASTIRGRLPYHNSAFVSEAMTYVIAENGSTNASGSAHDDRVIAYSLAAVGRLWAPEQRVVTSLAADLGLQDFTTDARYGVEGTSDLYGHNPYAGNADGLGWTSESRY